MHHEWNTGTKSYRTAVLSFRNDDDIQSRVRPVEQTPFFVLNREVQSAGIRCLSQHKTTRRSFALGELPDPQTSHLDRTAMIAVGKQSFEVI
jgi:hypothetical protein